MASLDDCYAVLGVPAYAPRGDVSAKYRLLIQVWHPDRFEHQKGIRAQAEEQMKQITAAFKQIEAAGFPERTPAAPAAEAGARATSACPWCARANRLPAGYAGQEVRCGGCGGSFRRDGAGRAVRLRRGATGRHDLTPSHVKCPSCGASNWCVPDEMVACVACGAFFSWS